MNSKTKRITLCAVSLALIIALAPVPYVFLIPLLVLSIVGGWAGALAAGATFGVVSYLYAFAGGSPVGAAFVAAPWIPIVPRIFVGLAARGAYLLGRKLFKDKGKGIPAYLLAAAAGSLTNTGLVVPCLMFTLPPDLRDAIYGYLTVIFISGAIELVANCVILPPLAFTLDKVVFGKHRRAADTTVGTSDGNPEALGEAPTEQATADSATAESAPVTEAATEEVRDKENPEEKE